MSEDQKEKAVRSHEQSTIEEGEAFKTSTVIKVVNLDEQLKKSYPEGFHERSKKKRSSRKS